MAPTPPNLISAAEPFTVEAGGTSSVTGGQSISRPHNIIFGIEGNGVIQFAGTYSSLTWTNPILENDYAFTLGSPTASSPNRPPSACSD